MTLAIEKGEKSSVPAELPPVDPPDGGYGWVCVIAVFINGFTWGIVAPFGAFLASYINNDVFPGATTLDYAFIGGLNFSVAMLMAPVATKTCRHFPSKFTLAAGIVCMSGGFITAVFTTQVWQLFLSQGPGSGWAVALRRSLANGIASAGSGIGALSMSFAIQAAIEKLGIASVLRITGIVVLAVNVPACAVLRTGDHYIFPSRAGFGGY